MTDASPSNYLFPASFKKIIGHQTPNISVSNYIKINLHYIVNLSKFLCYSNFFNRQ